MNHGVPYKMLQALWEDGPKSLQLWEMLYAMSNLSRLTIQISMLEIEKYYDKTFIVPIWAQHLPAFVEWINF